MLRRTASRAAFRGAPRGAKAPSKAQRPRARRFSDRPASHALELLVFLGILAAFGAGFYHYMCQTDLFKVKTVRIEGADVLDETEILRQSQVSDQDCLLLMDTRAVRRRIEAIPFVHTCRVKRIFPRTLVITIEERVPLATLLANSRLYELDQECTVLRELAPGEPHVGPFITNVENVGYVEPGKRLDVPSLRMAVVVWKAFCRTAMAREVTVSELAAPRESLISMYCDEFAGEIRWGRGDLAKQARKLDITWRSYKNTLAASERYIDLRFGDDVACR